MKKKIIKRTKSDPSSDILMTLFTGNVPGAQQNSKAERKVDDEGGKLSFLRGKRQSLSLGLAKENEIFSSSGVIIIFKKKKSV